MNEELLELKLKTLLESSKPYLAALDEKIAPLEYGEATVKFTVRAGIVEKMEFFENKTWLRPKKGHLTT